MKYCYLSWHLLQSFVFTQNEILIIAVPPPPRSFQDRAAALQCNESVRAAPYPELMDQIKAHLRCSLVSPPPVSQLG